MITTNPFTTDNYLKAADELKAIITKQAKEIEQLREALQFYANIENWRYTISLGHPQIDGMTSQAKRDCGHVARAALKESE